MHSLCLLGLLASITVSGARPASVVAAATTAPTFYLAGDSTMAADNGEPYIGWGTQVSKYLSIPVVNDAIAGRSSRSFTDEGRFTGIANAVQPDDIVVIEFGHNDGGGATTIPTGVCAGTDATTTCNVNGTIVLTFNGYIENAVNLLKSKGARVIVSSQTPDNPFNVTGVPRFVGYAQQAAVDTGVSYVDHYDLVMEEFTALGETVVNAFYPVDHTHTNAAGADIVAQTFVRGVLCDSENPLRPFVTNQSVAPGKDIHWADDILNSKTLQPAVFEG